MDRLSRGARVLAVAAVCLALLAAGCEPRKGGVLRVIPQGNQYEVTYQYTLAHPPPRGQVYVFWLVNVDDGQMVRMGTVQPGVNRVVRVQVSFPPTGAIVSPEPDANVDHPGKKWELMDGRVTK